MMVPGSTIAWTLPSPNPTITSAAKSDSNVFMFDLLPEAWGRSLVSSCLP
jgi:hypothetical protein